MQWTPLCSFAVAAICVNSQYARAETLQVQIYADDFAQVSVIAGNRVVSRTKWLRPPQNKNEAKPRVVNMPCNLFPCSIRVRWSNNTYENFGPIKLDSGFDGERKLVVAIRPLWETRSEEYTCNVWDGRKRRWIRKIFTREYSVTKYVPEYLEEEGYILPHEEMGDQTP